MLSRWDSFARFVSDGRICMTNTGPVPAEGEMTL
jgi:hypothetical protein